MYFILNLQLKYTIYTSVNNGFLTNNFVIFVVGGIDQKQLVLYKTSTFIKLVTSYTTSVDEDINKLAKNLLCLINDNIDNDNDVLYC